MEQKCGRQDDELLILEWNCDRIYIFLVSSKTHHNLGVSGSSFDDSTLVFLLKQTSYHFIAGWSSIRGSLRLVEVNLLWFHVPKCKVTKNYAIHNGKIRSSCVAVSSTMVWLHTSDFPRPYTAIGCTFFVQNTTFGQRMAN